MPTTIELAGAILFAAAILHTFTAKVFESIAQRFPAHAGIWHLLGEVEVVFGFWALVLVAFIGLHAGSGDAVAYLDSRNFTEPMFVFVIMVIAATRPILQTTKAAIALLARAVPLPDGMVSYFLVLAVAPQQWTVISGPA